MTNPKINIGQRITTCRKRAGLTVPGLAKKADVSKGYLWQVENGQKDNPTVKFLTKTANALEITWVDLIIGGDLELRHNAPESTICNFCGKNKGEVSRLIAGPEVHICDECVELCAEIIKPDPKFKQGDVVYFINFNRGNKPIISVESGIIDSTKGCEYKVKTTVGLRKIGDFYLFSTEEEVEKVLKDSIPKDKS